MEEKLKKFHADMAKKNHQKSFAATDEQSFLRKTRLKVFFNNYREAANFL